LPNRWLRSNPCRGRRSCLFLKIQPARARCLRADAARRVDAMRRHHHHELNRSYCARQQLVIRIMDVDDFTNPLVNAQEIGKVECTLARVVSSPLGRFESPLTGKGGMNGKGKGCLLRNVKGTFIGMSDYGPFRSSVLSRKGITSGAETATNPKPAANAQTLSLRLWQAHCDCRAIEGAQSRYPSSQDQGRMCSLKIDGLSLKER